jgi:protein gp37
VFVNSMSDLFHERMPTSFLKEVFIYCASLRPTREKRQQRSGSLTTSCERNLQGSTTLGAEG